MIHMHQGFVPHEQCTHDLQGWNLQWEVEGCDQCHGPVWPSHTMTGLTHVVTRVAETPSKEANLQEPPHCYGQHTHACSLGKEAEQVGTKLMRGLLAVVLSAVMPCEPRWCFEMRFCTCSCDELLC